MSFVRVLRPRFALATLLVAWASASPIRGETVLFDNGPFITHLDGCTQLEVPARSTPQAPNATLGILADAGSQRVFDDFTIPPGEAWDLERLRWRMYQPDSPLAAQLDSAVVRLWLTDPRLGGEPLAGDLVTDRHLVTLLAEVQRTAPSDPLSCARYIKNVEIDAEWLPVLPAGHYWIEVGFRSSIVAGPFAPPTEPRSAADDGGVIHLSGQTDDALDEGSGAALDFPFQLTGAIVPDPARACVLPAGGCQELTLSDCTASSGTWSYLHACAELGACCDHADGTCREFTAPGDCASSTQSLSPGMVCAAVPSCGRLRGACCFADDVPVDCQSLVRGIDCAAQGGNWHAGHCSAVMCHDFCETPAVAHDGDQSFITVGATSDGPQAGEDCGYDPAVGAADIWYHYTSSLAAPGGTIAFSVCNNDGYDATLQVYGVDETTACTDLLATALDEACDNDGCGAVQGPARVTVPAGPGDRFWIRIGGYAGDEGAGQLTILPIEAGFGACCLPDGGCAILAAASCAAAGGGFQAGSDCFNLDETCGPTGACCAGADGCSVTTERACIAQAASFLGESTTCESSADCDGDGETDQCALALGAADCNTNNVPDACDIDPVAGVTTDCDTNGVPDECDPLLLCCPGDTNRDTRIDGQDAASLAAALLNGETDCRGDTYCRADTNADHRLDGHDIAAFVQRVVSGSDCAPLVHLSARVFIPNSNVTNNQVFICDAGGKVISRYDQIAPAFTDSLGYRDGASDGAHVYFGFLGGVARHDADGRNGVRIITGAVPGTGATWRALAFDPTGDDGRGSLWTQSFNSDLVETDLQGNLLTRFPNSGAFLYGLAYDRTTGMLWGHHQHETTASATLVEIDPETGLMTGVRFPSHFNVPGASIEGFAFHGGLSMYAPTRTLFGVLQGTADALFSADTLGMLAEPIAPNPRLDLQFQTGSNAVLGVAVVPR